MIHFYCFFFFCFATSYRRAFIFHRYMKNKWKLVSKNMTKNSNFFFMRNHCGVKTLTWTFFGCWLSPIKHITTRQFYLIRLRVIWMLRFCWFLLFSDRQSIIILLHNIIECYQSHSGFDEFPFTLYGLCRFIEWTRKLFFFFFVFGSVDHIIQIKVFKQTREISIIVHSHFGYMESSCSWVIFFL